jgi:recombinational DNA repair protein RecR
MYSEDPVKLFFDLDNIAFSHLRCNVSAAKRKRSKCGTPNAYKTGCRCKECTMAHRDYKRIVRARNKAKVVKLEKALVSNTRDFVGSTPTLGTNDPVCQLVE